MRRPDWEQQLASYLASVEARAFEWGEHDCATNCANAVAAMTGTDFAAPFRGKYRTRRGSLAALRRYGAGTLEATIDTLFPVIEPAFARRGDLALVDGMLGIVIGADAVCVGREGDREGLVRFARATWSKAWRI